MTPEATQALAAEIRQRVAAISRTGWAILGGPDMVMRAEVLRLIDEVASGYVIVPAGGVDVERLREVSDAATDGPWFNDYGKIGSDNSDSGHGEMDSSEDGALVVAAVNYVRAALADTQQETPR